MKQIRQQVFETNSSSSHSLAMLLDLEESVDNWNIVPDENGKVILTGNFLKGKDFPDDFSKNHFIRSSIDKANYCAVLIYRYCSDYGYEQDLADNSDSYPDTFEKAWAQYIKNNTYEEEINMLKETIAEQINISINDVILNVDATEHQDEFTINHEQTILQFAFKNKNSLKGFIFNPRYNMFYGDFHHDDG